MIEFIWGPCHACGLPIVEGAYVVRIDFIICADCVMWRSK